MKIKAKKNQRASYEVEAKFDNARITPDTQSLFRNVDSLSIVQALSPAVRRIVRDRARYVVANCPYAGSMLSTFSGHVLGGWATVSFPRGKRVLSDAICTEVSEAFDAWATATKFWAKIKTMIRAKVTDGEAFAILTTDPSVVTDLNAITLNLKLIECDRVESFSRIRENEIDGIRFDASGNPVEYRILDYHPGDYRNVKGIYSGKWVNAKYVIHYFDILRPEQVRGVSDFLAALEIPASQKSYRSSVVDSAIQAASISGVLSTDSVPECFNEQDEPIGKCAMSIKPETVFQTQRNALVTLPEGWKLQQFNAAQPTSQYGDFVRDLTAEMAACLCMPVNIAMCDSSQHNFASAKLDHMTYGDKINDVRTTLSLDVLDRVFFAWLDEYAVQHDLSADIVRELHRTEWLFTERANSDVMKDASAENTRLNNGTTTRATLFAKSGRDWKRETLQALEEDAFILSEWKKLCVKNGLDENTPCPFLGVQKKEAPTEDMIEHEAERKVKDGRSENS